MSAQIISHRYFNARRLVRLLSKAQEQAEQKTAAKWDELHRNRVTMREWTPDDDNDPEVA